MTHEDEGALATSTRWRFGGEGAWLNIDVAAWEVRVNGEEVGLSPTQFRLLVLLAQHAGTLVTLDQIHSALWGQWFGSKDNVSVHIHNLRRALGPCAGLILTRRGGGYLLRSTPAGQAGVSATPCSLAFLDDLQRDAARRDVVWLVLDRFRVISWVSDTITALTGWPVNAVVGRTPFSLVHESERETFAALFPLQGGSPEVATETLVVRADGHAIPARFSGKIIMDAGGSRLMGVGEMRLLPAVPVLLP